ncbi:MAG: hypothetical protein JWN72_507 [Thermoleophilia bacterium]|nr:hypothetical protein [Thermoleophilia bacterium]
MTSTIGAAPTSDTASKATPSSVAEIKDAALEKTTEVREKLGAKVSERAFEQADERSTAIGEHASTIAEALTSTSSSLRGQGEDMPAKALDAVTERVEQVGSYLTNTDGEKILHDIEAAARKRPWVTAAALFGIGFAASRVLGASSKDRYGASASSSNALPEQAWVPAPQAVGTGATRPALDSGGATLMGGASNAVY